MLSDVVKRSESWGAIDNTIYYHPENQNTHPKGLLATRLYWILN